MRTPMLVGGVLVAALVLPTAHSVAHAATVRAPDRAGTVEPRSDAWEAKVLRLTNARRKAHDVRPLKAGKCPDHFAESWTRHMARTHDFEHQSLAPFFDRCEGITTAGENIAYGYETPRALVSAWMHSQGHRENILNPSFRRIGVSGWRASDGTTYATQDFVG
jgi:uncharacterized protein YkwD